MEESVLNTILEKLNLGDMTLIGMLETQIFKSIDLGEISKDILEAVKGYETRRNYIESTIGLRI